MEKFKNLLGIKSINEKNSDKMKNSMKHQNISLELT
jgi:hypothetical protein